MLHRLPPHLPAVETEVQQQAALIYGATWQRPSTESFSLNMNNAYKKTNETITTIMPPSFKSRRNNAVFVYSRLTYTLRRLARFTGFNNNTKQKNLIGLNPD